MWVQPLGWEDPLEKAMTIHSSILAWRTSWTEEPGGLKPIGLQCDLACIIAKVRIKYLDNGMLATA